MSKQVWVQWVGRETEIKKEGWRRRGGAPVGWRNEVELDFRMDKFTQGFQNKAAIRAIESIMWKQYL